MDPKLVQKGLTGVLLAMLLGLGVLRITAQIEPIEPNNLQPGIESPPDETPQTVVGPDGSTYVRADIREAVMQADGIIAVLTDRSAYAWSNRTNTWYAIILSGQPFDMVLSGGTVGVLTSDHAYAWSDQTNEWIFTFTSGVPRRITGSNGHLGVMTDREAYAWNRDTHNWFKTILSGTALELTGLDDYYQNRGSASSVETTKQEAY
ncbi:MAG: hypothetical protein LLF76_01610 [Planctomycetaceae bacterium]|nr:hypothetical protein [Planctomycetaceae bacterium]